MSEFTESQKLILSDIGRKILEIRDGYERGDGTPGGLEHMGDVQKLIYMWAAMIDPPPVPSLCDACGGTGQQDDIGGEWDEKLVSKCSKCEGAGAYWEE